MKNILYIAIILISSCARDLPKAIGSKPKAVAQQFSSTSDAAPAIDHGTVQTVIDNTSPHFFKANYKVSVRTSGIQLCDAEIQFAVSSRLGMDGNPVLLMDKHVIKCKMGIKVDLLKVLSGMGMHMSGGLDGKEYNKPGNPNAPSMSTIKDKLSKLHKNVGLKADKNAIYLDHLRIMPVINARYTPSRAFLPNIIGGEEADLEAYDVTQKITVSDLISNEDSEGYIHLKMQEWKKPFKSKYLKDIPFKDTALISVKSRSFKGINKLRVFIPEKFKIRISRDPVAVINMSAEVKILDALGLGQTKQQVLQMIESAKSEGGLVTNLTATLLQNTSIVNIALIDQEGIRDLLKDESARETTKDF